ncbi:LOW QUALITY PROTEIN: 56 kDa gametocyte antigen, related [Eimeria mitis]|uniref:56 kDa gametocyte antigen, related n=1 Tax=Eimeria mitis TaxID=44415 RepID=U6KDJ7_9EIME|nr:LOW QUALITY PROTEIN: 56 kDa gametocyte antigen, related [Eimeria mitis]CDJ36024.1 56 kDa gametocyte antigen, related [Eimeria mitis]
MIRYTACSLAAVALAAGQSFSLPIPIDRPLHRLGEMNTYQAAGAAPSPAAESSSSSTSTAAPDSAQQWLENFNEAVQKQLQLQESLMKQLMTDIQEYLSNTFGWGDGTNTTALERVNSMLEMISSRMAVTREAATEMVSETEVVEEQKAREATRKFMKEVRVQDIVVDALWASLRGVQTSAWMSGLTGSVEERDVFNAANRAAEEFLVRMYHNLRAAGVDEEDIVKYVPKTNPEEENNSSSPTRNMGHKRGYYGYGYGYRYSYPQYSYYYPRAYPVYPQPVPVQPIMYPTYTLGYPMQYTPSQCLYSP